MSEDKFIYQESKKTHDTVIASGVQNKDVIVTIKFYKYILKTFKSIFQISLDLKSTHKLRWPFSPSSAKYRLCFDTRYNIAGVIIVITVIAALKPRRYNYAHAILDLRTNRPVSLLSMCVETLASWRTNLGIKRTLREANRHWYHVTRMNMYATGWMYIRELARVLAALRIHEFIIRDGTLSLVGSSVAIVNVVHFASNTKYDNIDCYQCFYLWNNNISIFF